MKTRIASSIQDWARLPAKAALAAIGALAIAGAPATAQEVESFDPDEAYASSESPGSGAIAPDTSGIDADLMAPGGSGQSVADWSEPVRVQTDQS